MNERLSFKTMIYLIAIFLAFAASPLHAQETGPAGSVMRVPSAGGKARLGPVDLSSANATTGRLNATTRLSGLTSGGCLFGDTTGYVLQPSSPNCVWDITNNALGIGSAPNSKASLDVASTTKGVLLPRMTSAQKNAINSPPNGLLLYDTDLSRLESYSTGTSSWGPVGRLMGTANSLNASAAFQVDSTTRGSLSVPRMTTSQRDAIATPATGLQVYNTDTNALNVYNGSVWTAVGSGAGGGEKNFLSNGDFENGNTTGWTCFSSGLSVARPTDAMTFAGSPTVSMGIATTSFAGSYSGKFVKTAANSQGQGCYTDFAVEDGDLGKVLQGNIEYKVESGTFVAGDRTTDSSAIVYIYDRTNSKVIEPSSIKFLSNSTAFTDIVSTTFQTSTNSKLYRIFFYIPDTSTTAFSLALDSMKMARSKYPSGTPITDWTPTTPTGTWTTNTTYSGMKRRVGDTIEEKVKIVLSGAPNNATLTINTQNTIDTVKAIGPSGDQALPIFGNYEARDQGNTSYNGIVEYGSSTSVQIVKYTVASPNITNNSTTQTLPFTWGSGDSILVSFAYPAVGLSSSVQMSDLGDGRSVSFSSQSNTGQSVTANVTNATYVATKDSHGAWNGSQFTAPQAGDYFIAATGKSSTTANLIVYRSGIAEIILMTVTSAQTNSGSVVIPNVKSGEILSIRSDGSTTLTSGNTLGIFRIGGSGQAIASSETVSAIYTTSAGQNLNNNVAGLIDFGTKVEDSHNAVTTGGSWNFRAPIAGLYSVKANISMPFNNTTVVYWLAYIYKNTSTLVVAGPSYSGSTTTGAFAGCMVETEVRLIAGDTISIQAIHSSGTARNLTTGATDNRISIVRVGN